MGVRAAWQIPTTIAASDVPLISQNEQRIREMIIEMLEISHIK
jgi:hypothetical protein